MLQIHLDAKPDHVLRLAKRKDPRGAVAEMIWNALDAEASLVEVEIQANDIEGVDRVIVRDNGHGMPAVSCRSYFGDLGGSWKASAKVSPNLRRPMHGRSGQGRLRAYALGQLIRWTSVADSLTGGREKTVITADASSPTDFAISGPHPTQEPPGTVFDSRLPAENTDRLNHESTATWLTAEFALFLTLHPEVQVTFRGNPLDPSHAQVTSAGYVLKDVEGLGFGPASLRVIEWPKDPGRMLALCDSGGILLGSAPVGIQAPGHHFTAYVLWDGFRRHLDDLTLADWEDSALRPVMDAAREHLREHFRKREEERRREQVLQWQAERVYPYDLEPASAAHAAERQVFDHVATTIARRLPRAQAGKRVTLRLLREAVASDPDGLYPVLEELFNLTKTDREDLRRLLERTSLASLVRASTQVTNRLDFLAALKLMVFEPEVSGKVKERAELHRILEREQWVFTSWSATRAWTRCSSGTSSPSAATRLPCNSARSGGKTAQSASWTGCSGKPAAVAAAVSTWSSSSRPRKSGSRKRKPGRSRATPRRSRMTRSSQAQRPSGTSGSSPPRWTTSSAGTRHSRMSLPAASPTGETSASGQEPGQKS